MQPGHDEQALSFRKTVIQTPDPSTTYSLQKETGQLQPH